MTDTRTVEAKKFAAVAKDGKNAMSSQSLIGERRAQSVSAEGKEPGRIYVVPTENNLSADCKSYAYNINAQTYRVLRHYEPKELKQDEKGRTVPIEILTEDFSVEELTAILYPKEGSAYNPNRIRLWEPRLTIDPNNLFSLDKKREAWKIDQLIRFRGNVGFVPEKTDNLSLKNCAPCWFSLFDPALDEDVNQSRIDAKSEGWNHLFRCKASIRYIACALGIPTFLTEPEADLFEKCLSFLNTQPLKDREGNDGYKEKVMDNFNLADNVMFSWLEKAGKISGSANGFSFHNGFQQQNIGPTPQDAIKFLHTNTDQKVQLMADAKDGADNGYSEVLCRAVIEHLLVPVEGKAPKAGQFQKKAP